MLSKNLIAGVAVLLSSIYSAAFAQSQEGQDATAEEKTVFGAWQYSCEGGVCQAVLTMADKKTNDRLVSWAFIYDPPNDRLSSVVTIPLGVALPTGLYIELSGDRTMNWPYQVCDNEGCRAVAVIDEATEAALSFEESVQVKFVPYGSRGAVAMPIPMEGFKEAKDKLKAQATQ